MNIFYLQSQVRRRTEPNVTEESGSVGKDQAVLSEVIYHSGQTGIWSHLAVHGLRSLDFSFVMFISSSASSPCWWRKSTRTVQERLFQLLGSFVSSMSRTSPVWGMRVEKPWLLATVFSVFSCLGDETHHESWITLSHCFSSIFYNPWENNGQGYTITIITAHVPGQHILSWQQSRPQPFINTYYSMGHRLVLKFSLCTIFAQCSSSSSSTSGTWELRTWKLGQILENELRIVGQ